MKVSLWNKRHFNQRQLSDNSGWLPPRSLFCAPPPTTILSPLFFTFLSTDRTGEMLICMRCTLCRAKFRQKMLDKWQRRVYWMGVGWRILASKEISYKCNYHGKQKRQVRQPRLITDVKRMRRNWNWNQIPRERIAVAAVASVHWKNNYTHILRESLACPYTMHCFFWV